MKKVFSIVCILAVLVIAGCKSNNISKIKIRFMDFVFNKEEMKRMDSAIKEFNRLHPGIEVNVEYTPGGTVEKFFIETTAGVAPDVVCVNDTSYPALVEGKTIISLDSLIKEDKDFDISDFYPSALRYGRVGKEKGQLYVMPALTGTIIMYYNKDMFDEAKLAYPKDGWTWEEFRDDCKKLTKDKNRDGKIDQYALSGWELLAWYPMILQNGGHIISEDGKKCLLSEPKSIEALEFVKTLHTKDKVIVSTFEASGMTGMSYEAMMASGKVAMFCSDFSIYKTFSNINWDIVSLPEKKGGRKVFHGGCWGYAISSQSKHQKEAWELIKHLVSKEVLRDWVRNSPFGLHARMSLKEEFFKIPFFKGKHVESYLYACNYPNYEFQIRKYNEVLSVMSEIRSVITGMEPGDVKEVSIKVTKKLNTILSQ